MVRLISIGAYRLCWAMQFQQLSTSSRSPRPGTSPGPPSGCTSPSRRSPSRSGAGDGSWAPSCSAGPGATSRSPTPGEALLPLARRILADADTARHEVQELAQLRRGRVRLGRDPEPVHRPAAGRAARLPRPLPRHPAADRGGRLARPRTRAGRAAPSTSPWSSLPLPSPTPALTTVELLREDLVVVSAPEAPAARRRAGCGSPTCADEPLVMFRHGYDLRELTVGRLPGRGLRADFAVEGGEMDAVLGFVRAGLGVAVVPRMVATPAGRGCGSPRWPARAAPHDRAGAPQRRRAAAGGAGSCSGCCWA